MENDNRVLVRVTQNYFDREMQEVMKPRTTFNCTVSRAKVLLQEGVAIIEYIKRK